MDYQKGQLVLSKAGRDQGLFFAVLSTVGDKALIANGKERRLDKPKAKKLKHLAATRITVSEDALTTDKLLRKAIADLTASLATT
ncbi:MAG: KOW domain-containing RNA-binding protein [Evtepia sp.]